MSEESTVQGGLVDPLSDPGKAAIYFDTYGFHPDRETIKQEVQDYYTKAFPEQEQEKLDYQKQSDTSTPTSVQFDEYDSPLTADFAQEAYPVLREAAKAAGQEGEAVDWVAVARHYGEDDGADALEELRALAEKYPGGSWRKDAALVKKVYALNLRLDHATLRLWSRHGGGQ